MHKIKKIERCISKDRRTVTRIKTRVPGFKNYLCFSSSNVEKLINYPDKDRGNAEKRSGKTVPL